MAQTNRNQTAADPEIDPEAGKPIKWGERTLYKTPRNTFIYLTKRELTIAKKVDKLYEEGKLKNTVSPASLNLFFRQRYIMGLEGEEGFFAKQYFKSYILDFEAYKKNQENRKKSKRLQELGEGSVE